jgi:hypothetical protein
VCKVCFLLSFLQRKSLFKWTPASRSHRSVHLKGTRCTQHAHNSRGFRLRTLIAFRKHAKGLDLFDEVGDARPSPEPDANHRDVHTQQNVHRIHARPAGEKERQLLHRTLHHHQPHFISNPNDSRDRHHIHFSTDTYTITRIYPGDTITIPRGGYLEKWPLQAC